MLVMTRKINESIVIGDDVVVVVFGIKGKRVDIGVKAPPHVAVWREELVEIARERGEAMGPHPGEAEES